MRYSVTMREPGASEVLMCGLTLRPASTAFFASRPAASSTLGFEVLVQEVMAAISTSPLPTVMSPCAGIAGSASCSAAARVGLLAAISSTERGAPGGAEGVCGIFAPSPSPLRASAARTRWRVSSCAAGWLKPFSVGGLEKSEVNCFLTLPSSIRSCGRFGPARLGVTVPRSRLTICE